MTILDSIVEHKRIEVLKRKGKYGLSDLEDFPHYQRSCNQLLPTEGPGIIAEFKRSSPSRGLINGTADPVGVARAYQKAGVRAMSVLTDRKFFGGSFRDLKAVREACPALPLLRKDFMVDPYQLHEAKAYGADIILLIAAILEPSQLAELAAGAASLGLQVLLEVHNEKELESWVPGIALVGVNNRDLRTFQVDTDRSLELLPHFPADVLKVSESGLSSVDEVRRLHREGFELFLMGENFMKGNDPGQACSDFISLLP